MGKQPKEDDLEGAFWGRGRGVYCHGGPCRSLVDINDKVDRLLVWLNLDKALGLSGIVHSC